MGRLRKLITLLLMVAILSVGIITISSQEIASQISRILGRAVAQVADCKGLLLQTGQTTQYDNELDDGFYRKGIPKSYTVLTLGQYALTSNIDLIHLQRADVSFTAPGTITCAGQMAVFLAAGGDVIIITGSGLNNGTFTSTAAGANTITVAAGIVNEPIGALVSIAKREAHLNSCVYDNNTCLMWSRTVSNKMGPASNGKMPWTGQTYDIFAYCTAANLALLGGYGDWRVANRNELVSLLGTETTSLPNAAAFPGFPDDPINSSTSEPQTTTNVEVIIFGNNHHVYNLAKTNSYYVLLVRGG